MVIEVLPDISSTSPGALVTSGAVIADDGLERCSEPESIWQEMHISQYQAIRDASITWNAHFGRQYGSIDWVNTLGEMDGEEEFFGFNQHTLRQRIIDMSDQLGGISGDSDNWLEVYETALEFFKQTSSTKNVPDEVAAATHDVFESFLHHRHFEKDAQGTYVFLVNPVTQVLEWMLVPYINENDAKRTIGATLQSDKKRTTTNLPVLEVVARPMQQRKFDIGDSSTLDELADHGSVYLVCTPEGNATISNDGTNLRGNGIRFNRSEGVCTIERFGELAFIPMFTFGINGAGVFQEDEKDQYMQVRDGDLITLTDTVTHATTVLQFEGSCDEGAVRRLDPQQVREVLMHKQNSVLRSAQFALGYILSSEEVNTEDDRDPNDITRIVMGRVKDQLPKGSNGDFASYLSEHSGAITLGVLRACSKSFQQ